MQERRKVESSVRAPGIFDTIAAAMSIVLMQPLFLILPALLDAYYWLGARLSPEVLTDAVGRWFIRTGGDDGRRLGESLSNNGAGADLTTLIGVFVPSLLGGVNRDGVARLSGERVVRPEEPWLVVATGLLLLLTGLGLGILFRVLLTRGVRETSPRIQDLVRAVVVAWLRFLGFLALLVGLLALVLGPILVIGVLFALVGVNLAPLLTLAVLGPIVAAAIFFYFAPDAIVVSEVGPLRAGYLSFNIVRRNFWPAVGFIVVVFVISIGLPLVWTRMLGNVPGVMLALLGNAFVATGLVLAQMRFYYDRLQRWRADLAPAPAVAP